MVGVSLVCLVLPVAGCSLVLQWSQRYHHSQRRILGRPLRLLTMVEDGPHERT